MEYNFRGKSMNYKDITQIEDLDDFIYAFNEEFDKLKSKENIEDALDFIFDTIEDMLVAGKTKLVNDAIDNINLSEMYPSVLLALLAITYFWEEHIPNRKYVLRYTQSKIRLEYPEDRATALLDGIK